VLVHGFTQTGQSWARVAEALATDHEVVSVDAPGHGGSGTTAADLPTGALLLGATGGPGTYVGYSMGGRYCLHLALAEPATVRGLVLVGATGGIADDEERAARRRADEALADRLERVGLPRFLDDWLAQPLFAGLPPDAQDRDDRLRNSVAGLAASLRLAGTGTQEPLWDRLGALTVPVLVVAGEHDAKFRGLGDRLAAAIGANARSAVVPGAGHAAHLEQPAVFVDLLRGWLDEHGL
jgi:2-succinyl-6-hydroxy-2,4-cyclohexadiene-1-carboxylate synthase